MNMIAPRPRNEAAAGGSCPCRAWSPRPAITRSRPTTLTPERLFEQQWALTLLDQVLSRLQAEMTAAGKAALFESMKGHLAGGGDESYAATAARLGMSEGAVKVAVHRLRRRYREFLQEEISHTVAGPEEIEEEIRYLFTCL